MAENYYDEELDQEANVRDGADKAEKESGYESFLAPKSAFGSKSLEVGAVHRVKVERTLDDEVMLRCIEGKGDDDEMAEEETEDEMYS